MSIPTSDHYIRLTHDGNNANFYSFAEETYPIQYIEEASFEYTPLGTAYSSGPARRQKRIFTISAYVDYSEWLNLNTVFEGWDTERSTGRLAQVQITSTLLTGVAEIYYGFFTTPPVLQKIGPANDSIFLATFALSEV